MYLFVLLFLLLGYSDVSQAQPAGSGPAVAQFVFGDSLVDQGNNNNLQSLAKANSPPNGIDLALSNHQPTGRFGNGRIISDFLSEYMNTAPIVAYNDAGATGTNLLRGCNFASAGSGVLDDTGNIFIQKITITQQLQYFQNVQREITSLLGATGASQLLSSALYSFTTGGNDYVNNYLIPGSARARQYPNIDDYTDLLISTFQGQVRALYNLGARKLSISNIGPIGCIPDQLAIRSIAGTCVDNVNQMAVSFNSQLKPMLAGLSQQLPGLTIAVSDSYSLVWDFIRNPGNYGFTTTNVACCGTGRFNGNIPCTAVAALCPDRNVYVFWDPFHPTDKANSFISQKLLFGGTDAISPINLSQLIPQ